MYRFGSQKASILNYEQKYSQLSKPFYEDAGQSEDRLSDPQDQIRSRALGVKTLAPLHKLNPLL